MSGIIDRAMAESMSGLDGRENLEAVKEELRCQLGLYETVAVQTSAFRTVSEKVFRLKAFGRTWDQALDMWEREEARKKKA